MEEVYKKAHNSIRADPSHKKVEKKAPAKKRWNKAKYTLEERKGKVNERKEAFLAKLRAENEA